MIDTYEALRNRLVDAIGLGSLLDIDATDVSYGNMSYDPTGKDAWLAVYYIPAEVDSLAKDRFDEEIGIFQISAYVPLNDTTGGTPRGMLRLNQLSQDILNVFYKNSVASANGIDVHIQESIIRPAESSESWMGRDISINYIRN
jgi:hypothetical protein